MAIGRIPPRVKRGWTVEVDGELQMPSLVRLTNPRIGELTYGWIDEPGYDGWVFEEHRNGGVVVVPYRFDDLGDLLVGVVEQKRPNQGGLAWNLPRGFVDVGESQKEAAVRELREETAIDVTIDRIVELGGMPGNPNSAFFVTTEHAGVRFYAVEIAILPSHQSAAEGIRRTAFLKWWEVANLGDLFSVAAVARLLALLCHK